MVTFELRGVAKQYGSLQALQPLDLTVEAGERLAVIGPSGAGKSTLLRLLNTSLRPSTGKVVVFGEETSRLPDKRLRAIRSRIGTIYQQYLLVPQVSVFQNVIAGRLGKTSLWRATWSLLSPNEADRVSRVLVRGGTPRSRTPRQGLPTSEPPTRRASFSCQGSCRPLSASVRGRE